MDLVSSWARQRPDAAELTVDDYDELPEQEAADR